MRPLFRFCILVIISGVLVACSSSDDSEAPALPTINPVAVATETPVNTEIPISTLPPSATPSITPTRLTPPRISGLSAAEAVDLRFYNLISDFDPIAVDISGLRFVSRLGYGAGTAAREIAGGSYPIVISSANNGTVLLEQEITLQPATSLAALVIGTVATPQVLIIAEDVSPLDAEEARFNIVHTIPDDDPIELFRDGQSVTAPLTFTQQSGTQIIPAQLTTFSLVDGETELASVELDIEDRTSITLLMYSDPANLFQPGILVFQTTVPGRADARIIHMAPGIGPIDLYFDGQPAANNLEYTRNTNRTVIATGTNRVAVYAAGANPLADDAIVTTDFNVNPGQDLGIILLGTTEAPSIIRYEFDNSPVPTGTVRMTFIHALPGVSPVVPIVQDAPLDEISLLNYRAISPGVILDAIQQNFAWRDPDTSDDLEVASDVQLEAGRSYLYFFTGRTIDEPPIFLIDVVEQSEDLVIYEGGPTPTPEPTVSVRFVNALSDGAALDFNVADIPAALGVPANTASPNTPINIGEASISALSGGTEIGVIGFNFSQTRDYTVIAYGDLVNGVSLLITEDLVDESPEGFVTVRLVNLTEEESDYRLAYAAHTGPLFRPTADPTEVAEGESEPNIYPVSPNMISITGTVMQFQSSSQSVAPVGLQNFFIINEEINNVDAIIEAYTLEAGQQYEIIIQQVAGQEIPQTTVIASPAS